MDTTAFCMSTTQPCTGIKFLGRGEKKFYACRKPLNAYNENLYAFHPPLYAYYAGLYR